MEYEREETTNTFSKEDALQKELFSDKEEIMFMKEVIKSGALLSDGDGQESTPSEYQAADRRTLILDGEVTPVLEQSAIPKREEFERYVKTVEELLGIEEARDLIKREYPASEQAQKLAQLDDHVNAIVSMMLAADAGKRGDDLSPDPLFAESALFEEEKTKLLDGFKTEEARVAYERFMASAAAFDAVTGEGSEELIEAMDGLDAYIFDMPWEAVIAIIFENLRLILLIIAAHPRQVWELLSNGKAGEVFIQTLENTKKMPKSRAGEKKTKVQEDAMFSAMLSKAENAAPEYDTAKVFLKESVVFDISEEVPFQP